MGEKMYIYRRHSTRQQEKVNLKELQNEKHKKPRHEAAQLCPLWSHYELTLRFCYL